MTTRAALLSAIVAGSFAAMTALGALLTHGQAEKPLTLGDVLIPAAIPVLLVVAMTVAGRKRRSGNRVQ
ncbi:MAG: hypothetical protein PHQ28_15475 [Mycobacterium sp.]|nr:hypothetical protein [Mycobacterium sp.]